MISHGLSNILVCPVCKGELSVADREQKLLCRHCCLAFPVRNGIPVMLADQAEKMQ
jgi:uncharacterized protein YbaR (Trm112 family)